MTTKNNYTPKPKDLIRLKKDCTAVNTYDGVHESSLIGGKDGKEHLGTVLGIHCFGGGDKVIVHFDGEGPGTNSIVNICDIEPLTNEKEYYV